MFKNNLEKVLLQIFNHVTTGGKYMYHHLNISDFLFYLYNTFTCFICVNVLDFVM